MSTRRETVSDKKKKKMIMRELVDGRESATKLKVLLTEKPFESERSLFSYQQLVANVLRSFTHAISLLTLDGCHVAPPHRNLVDSGQNAPPPVTPSGNTDTTSYGKGSSVLKKNGRGCYNRRRSAQAWTVVSCTIDDNHAWRKYGQKEILNSKFPRSYFRCSHKYDQGCSAIKQVQQIQENPNLYQITYIAIHTCKAATKAPTFLVPNEQEDHHSSLPSDVTADDHHKVDPNPSQWLDLKDYYYVEEASKNGMNLKMESDDSNKADSSVYSCTTTIGGGSQCLQNMDFEMEFINLATAFPN